VAPDASQLNAWLRWLDPPGEPESTVRRKSSAAGRFDAFEVAARHAALSGQVDAATLPRVADQLADDGASAVVSYEIRGSADPSGRPALDINLVGAVSLTCQRCLQPFRWPIEQTTQVLLAHDERELGRLDDGDADHEVVLAAAPLDPVTVVEDELLLTLPFVPRCPEATCPAGPALATRALEEPKASPFAALAELPRRKGAKSGS